MHERMERPPLEGMREAPFTVARTDSSGDGMTLDGWGAVFNRLTVIDSWEGRFREQIAPGAMKRSFKETPPIIQFDHGRHTMIGSIPIAKLERIAEEVDPVLAPEGGAHIVGRFLDHPIVDLVRQAIEAEAISGMSFRFGVVAEAWATADGKQIRNEQDLTRELARSMDAPTEELPIRTLKQVKVPEMGPVVWPAYADTSVSTRSIIDLGALRRGDPEQRIALAEAMLIADMADEQPETSARSIEDAETQQDTDDSVVERVEVSDDAQRSTNAVGERPSKPRGLRDMDLVLRNQRDHLLRRNR